MSSKKVLLDWDKITYVTATKIPFNKTKKDFVHKLTDSIKVKFIIYYNDKSIRIISDFIDEDTTDYLFNMLKKRKFNKECIIVPANYVNRIRNIKLVKNQKKPRVIL